MEFLLGRCGSFADEEAEVSPTAISSIRAGSLPEMPLSVHAAGSSGKTIEQCQHCAQLNDSCAAAQVCKPAQRGRAEV